MRQKFCDLLAAIALGALIGSTLFLLVTRWMS